MKTIWEVSEEWTWNASNDDKMKEKVGLFVDCYDGRSWPVVACGGVFVSTEDTANKIKGCILLSSQSSKKRKSSKLALTIASSFGHVHAFLRDNDRVLNELEKRGTDDQCLMLIKKPKSGSKQMLKSQSWANLSTSDTNLYDQLDGGFHADSRKHHKYRMKRKQSDLQNLPPEGVSGLKAANDNSDQRTASQSNGDVDDDWRSEVMSEHSYLSNGHNNCRVNTQPTVDNLSSQGVYHPEINNNKKLSNNSRMYRSHNDIYTQPARLYDIRMGNNSGALKSDEFYQKPTTKREPQIKEDEEIDPVSRSHSVGDLTTGLTLSLVGQRKCESIQHIPDNNNVRTGMSGRIADQRILAQGVVKSNVLSRTSPPEVTNSKQLSLKNSRKYTSDINLSSVSRNINNNINMTNADSRSKTLDKPPAKPRRSLPALPIGDIVEKKKHYAEMVKQRMSLQSSVSGSSSRQSALSPYSASTSKNGTPQSDKEVSDLLEPQSAVKSSQMCNNNSVSSTQSSGAGRKNDNELLIKDGTAPPNVRSCDSGTATVTSLSSTVDSGYLTNDADNDMYSSSSYTKSLQKSAQSLYSGNKLQVYSYGGNNNNTTSGRRESTNTGQRDSDISNNNNNKKVTSSTLPRTHPYNRVRGDNSVPENKAVPNKIPHSGVMRRHTSVVNVSSPSGVSQMGSPLNSSNSKSFVTSTPNNLVKNTSAAASVSSISRPSNWMNSPPQMNSNNSTVSSGADKLSFGQSGPVNFTPNLLKHSVNSTSNLPSSYQKPVHENARRHASLGSLKDVNVTSNVPSASNTLNVNNCYTAPTTAFKPEVDGKVPQHFKPLQRHTIGDVPVNFTSSLQSPKGEHLVNPNDKENTFSNPTSPVIMQKGYHPSAQRKGSNSADLLSNRTGTAWSNLTSPKSVAVKEQHPNQNVQYLNDTNLNSRREGVKNLHGNQTNSNNTSYFPRSKLKDLNRNPEKMTDVRYYQNAPVVNNTVSSPVTNSRLQENRFVPLQIEKSEPTFAKQISDGSLPAHYNTLPSGFKLQHSDQLANLDESKTNNKNFPSLFQILQYHDLHSVRLSVKDKSFIFNNLRLCDCVITLPLSCKSTKRDSTVNQTPKGKYAQLGGPGSAFKPVKSQQGNTMIPVSMVTVADISHQLSKICDVGTLQKGDILIEVDEQLVIGKNVNTVKPLIGESDEDLVFTIARSKQQVKTPPPSSANDRDIEILQKQIQNMKVDLKRKERAISELNSMLPWKPIDEENGKEVAKNNTSSQSDSLLNGLSEDEFIV